MEDMVPIGLQVWCRRHGWQITRADPIVGGYAATLYHLVVSDSERKTKVLIYKKLLPERQREVAVYREVMRDFPELFPTVYGYVEEAGEVGLLMEVGGTPLKFHLSTLDFDDQADLLTRAVRWLADLHQQFATHLPYLIEKGLEAQYPVDSSVAWANDAVAKLQNIAKIKSIGNLTQQAAVKVKAMSDWFYPRYADWLRGRVTLTHGDSHLENLLVTATGFQLIDWEAACAAVPQRDLAVFVQDVLDDRLYERVVKAYFGRLGEHGWETHSPEFTRTFQAVLFDNTLMMLGWEIHKFQEGYLSESEITSIINVKLRWLQTAFASLKN